MNAFSCNNLVLFNQKPGVNVLGFLLASVAEITFNILDLPDQQLQVQGEQQGLPFNVQLSLMGCFM